MLPLIGLATLVPERFETRGPAARRALEPPPVRRLPTPENPPGGAAMAVVQTVPNVTEITAATTLSHDRFIDKSFNANDLCCLFWPRAVGLYQAQRKKSRDVTVVAFRL
jgi:hypothetical protein